MLQCEVLVWGFFALSCTFFWSEFKPDVIFRSFLSAYVGFHMRSSFQGQILKLQSKWLIHCGEGDLSWGSKEVPVSSCFPCCFPSFLRTCFSSPSFLGGRPSFRVSVVSSFPCCSCAGYGLNPRISMELFCHWSFLRPACSLFFVGFLNFFLSFLLILASASCLCVIAFWEKASSAERSCSLLMLTLKSPKKFCHVFAGG